MKKLMEVFIKTILVLGLLLIVQTNKTLAAGIFDSGKELNVVNVEKSEVTELPARKISGKIFLPNGEVAPTGGINIFIHPIRMSSENSWSHEVPKIVYIEEGKNFAEYSVSLDCDEAGGKYILGYDTYRGDYSIEGYYSINGTVVDMNSASVIQVNGVDITGIDIKVLPTRKITGKVSLPNGELAPIGGIDFDIQTIRKNNQSSYTQERSKTIHIEEGKNSAEYNLQVSCRENGEEYQVGYEILNDKINYVKLGYYALNGMTINKNEATIIKVLDKDITNINLEFIKGISITGKISLPEGRVASSDWINVDIFVSNKENNLKFNTFVSLRQGENQGNYSIVVPIQNESINYIVGYRYYGRGSDIYANGYYNSIKTTTMEEKATFVEAFKSDIENINMTVIPGKSIKGTINIPDNIDMTYSWMEFTISAYDESNGNKVKMSKYLMTGTRSIDYNLVVPSDGTLGYKVSYELPQYYIGNALKRGYYSNNGTVANSKDASAISISGKEIASINMTVLRLQDMADDYSDNLENSTFIENNSINDGIINYSGDKDYFKFQVLQKSTVKAYTTGSLYTIGELFNIKGERIIRSEYGGTYNNFNMIKILEPGTYYLGLSSNDLGVYTLNVETIADSSENQYKISVEDRGEAPTIEAIYFEGQRSTYEFDFRKVLSRGISKVGNEYVVTLLGFDWNKADKYYVWINDGTYLLRQVLTSADKGKTIILRPDDTYTKIKINIENAGPNFNVQNLSLYQDWNNGQTMFIDNSYKEMYIPAGKYSMQINGYNETCGYSILKNRVDISKENNVVYFNEEELAKLNINMADYTGGDLKLAVFSAAYFNSTYSLGCPYNINDIYVSKANYSRVWINFVNKDNWEYGYTMSNPNVTSDRTISLNSEFSCKINLENSHFDPKEETWLEGQLEITDSFNNRLTYISNRNIQGYNFVEGKIKLENTKETYEITAGQLDYPYIVLPNTNGTFYMTFYVKGGPIKIKSASTVITIGDPNGGTIINYDLNFDGSVDVNDIEVLGEGYGNENGDSSYDVNEDLNGDGVIDIFDLVILSKKIK